MDIVGTLTSRIVEWRRVQPEPLSLDQLHLWSEEFGTRIHLAVMVEPYLSKICSGEKFIESRLTRVNIAPYQRAESGDVILFKLSGGPITAIAQVGQTKFEEFGPQCTPASLAETFATGLGYEPGYVETKAEARFASLLWLTHVRRIASVPFSKSRATGVAHDPANFDRSALDVRARTAALLGVVMRTLALAGDMGSGKSTVAEALAATHGFALRSFGEVVREEARSRGFDPTRRQVLQDLGQELFTAIGAGGLVDRVLIPASSQLVIDGVRHLEVLLELRARIPDLVFVFLSAADESLDDRWTERGDEAERAESARHVVEAEVTDLRSMADYVIQTEHFEPARIAEMIAAAAESA